LIRERYDELRKETDPPTFEEFEFSTTQADIDETHLAVLARVMNSALVGTVLNGLRWAVIRIDSPKYPRLLTSDRPLVMRDGLAALTRTLLC
jgi:hypothetical protein